MDGHGIYVARDKPVCGGWCYIEAYARITQSMDVLEFT